MITFLWLVAAMLALLLLLGLWRVIQGPNLTDRMLAAQLAGSTGVALVVVLAWVMRNQNLLDVALLLALLAAISGIAFAKLLRPEQLDSHQKGADDHVDRS